MKKHFYPILIAIFLLPGYLSYSQDILLQSFDNPSDIGNWINSTAGSYTLSGTADAAEGSGAIAINYHLVADQGWGGSVDIQMLPASENFGDLSTAEGIRFWYKVTEPASDPNVSWTTKIYINSTGGVEEWHATLAGIASDASGEWTKAEILFSSFSIPSWLTTYDGILYLDQIKEIQMQLLAPEGTTTMGEILIDGLSAYAGGSVTEGTLLESFDALGDIGNWINSTAGSYALVSSSDAVEGTAAVCLDYILIADQSWGGSVDMQFLPDAAVYPDLTGEDGLRFNYKVLQPASVTNGVSFNVKLFINSTGGEEEWHAALTNVLGNTSGVWEEAKLPFDNFSIPSWLTTYDGVLYPDQILKIEVQVIANAMGIETNGNICLDNLTSYSSGDITIFEGFTLDNMDNPSAGVSSWINSTAGSYTFSNSSDAVQGDSAICLSYNLIGDQGWGGSVDVQFAAATGVFPDMTDHLGISFWYKVTEPASVSGNVSFIVKAFVNSTGGQEEWHKTIGGLLVNSSGEWTQALVPFTSFAIPNWLPTFDGLLYQDQIYQIQFQILGQEGTTTLGGICFDNLTSYDDEEVINSINTPAIEGWKIYPNPTSGQINILGLSQVNTVFIYDVNGRLVKMEANATSLDVSDLSSGLYVLRIQSNQGLYIAKFLKD
ncbi:MAG TPA: T9SS type A sorting domain-containing protein [Saprospiraceae bacterium]|nr:T9SS type A sorting domain-containing protein [Saprospiraceae bacterium]HMQ84032.1 T9SS type A sorting domain-containing protein [Saprospiraceae bacterium]